MELNVLSLVLNPHIIFITETWFTERSAPYFSNYDLFRRDRIDYHGGVAIFIRNDLPSSEIALDFSSYLSSNDIEQL